MDETKITAALPNLDVEITRREHPEDNAETLTLRMTAVPSFDAFAEFLKQQGGFPFLACDAGWMTPWVSPWLSWARLAQAAWAPWLQPKAPHLAWQRDETDDTWG